LTFDAPDGAVDGDLRFCDGCFGTRTKYLSEARSKGVPRLPEETIAKPQRCHLW
jgi:hypothetical protein